jgi:ADP-L-glycero-D-manno-heptose 6-epimerase
VRLFEGSGGYAAGEQRRDFVCVDDVVDANLWFLDHPDVSGIFNVGSGRASTYNQMAAAVINAVDRREGRPQRGVDELVQVGAIAYVPFPPALAGKYQSFTEADLAALRAAGYDAPFASVEDGVDRYVERLMAAA